jgi:MoaA/NifB/PqqE/SkfB family radical SAM enzyme
VATKALERRGTIAPMLTEEHHAAGVADKAPDKVAGHEAAAHEKRNWVRLTFDCNNRCVFCLDSDTHDGRMRARDDVKRQILDGRRAGATRLILSGGEPTIHPDYVDFIRLGARAGYRKIQTVTNGRLFSYPDFLGRCLDAGLSEITFSLHGPDARVHDALVGVQGAFAEEVAGLRAALADGRAVVNVDVVINRANVRHLATMLERFIAMGVREFDLLQVVPFGRAFTDGKDTLFYDLEEARPHLAAALAYADRPDVHLWWNRFPPQHLEGHERLIQDPYKLNDEVRGRKEEFARLLDEGAPLDSRDPARCRYCYLEPLCDTLEEVRTMHRFAVVRVDSEWEAQQEPVFGGDPASAERAPRRLSLPLYEKPSLETLVAASGAETLWVRAPDLPRALAAAARFPRLARLELELGDWSGVDGAPGGRRLVRAVVRDVAAAEALLALPGDFEVALPLSRKTAPWLLALPRAPERLVVFQPTHERLTEAAAEDVDLADFFRRFRHEVPVEGVPACASGRPPRPRPPTLDAAMWAPSGHLEIFRFAKRYILDRYRTKSLRCRDCIHDAACTGLHINHVRARGYAVMQPVRAPAV